MKIVEFAVGATLLLCTMMAVGCYHHVVRAEGTKGRYEIYEPNLPDDAANAPGVTDKATSIKPKPSTHSKPPT